MKHTNFRTICLSLLLMAAALTLTACGGKSIDLTNYVSIDAVSGADGYGHLEYSFDSYSVYQKIAGIDAKNDKDVEALFSEESLLKTEKI